MILTAKKLRELLDYNPETGEFTRIVSRRHVKSGSRAGGLKVDGYRAVKIDGKLYSEHRLAWLFVTGEMPRNGLDHINRIKDDNRWCNLREATQIQNCANQGLQRNNVSGVKGVRFRVDRNSWSVQIMVAGKRRWLGAYKTLEEAKSARIAAEKRLCGQFSYWESSNAA